MLWSRNRSVCGALVLVLIFAGCASPVGIRIQDPRSVQRYLTRSALTSDQPSDFSLNTLRRYDLLHAWEDDPDAVLAKLHESARAEDFPNASLHALAELSFLRAETTEQQAGYAAAVVYAFTLLFPGEGRAPLDPLDPRERVAADLYNRALTLAFKRTDKGTLALSGSGEIDLPFGHVSVSRSPDLLKLNGTELYDLQPVAEIEVKGLNNRYRQPGIGAPLAAKTKPLPGVVQVVPVGPIVRVPLTAVLVIDTPLAGLRSGNLQARLELFASLDTTTVEIDGRKVPLESEPTAALAASLAESRFWEKELYTFLGNAIGVRKESALGGIRPYKKGRIPVVLVHGTASSPARWADMVNDLLADDRLRDRYAFWLFTYDSGNPIAYSGWQLRDALTQAVERADPGGHDPCVRDMVVLGHSQGGLLTKLTVVDSGNLFWANVSKQNFDDVKLNEKTKELLKQSLFVTPLPFVTEVIFLATPQQGSYLAGPQFVRRLAERFVRLPSDVVRVGADLVTLAPTGAGDVSLNRMPTSIDNMSPGNGFIKALAQAPISPTVKTHSIIAVDAEGEGPYDLAGDGVVKYASAHFEPVDSELVVHSPHSGMQSTPQTIEEVRRILLAHSVASKCPAPAD
jgi:pimeloyl-ACP methyl ester carboxylesterase